MNAILQAIVTLAVLLPPPMQRAPTCGIDFTPKTPDEARIVAVEKEWCEAAVARDARRLDAVFADDVSWIETRGYRSKREVLARYLEEIREHGWRQTDVRIRVVGDVAIVQSHLHVRKSVGRRLVEEDHPSVAVLARRGGRWVVIIE